MAGFDQLQNLGSKTCQATLTIKSSQDGLGCLFQIAGMGQCLSTLFKQG
jgi:hypothetical protein